MDTIFELATTHAVDGASPRAANLYKVPILMLLSAASALPIGLLAWSALARERGVSTFLSAQARALFAAALVLGGVRAAGPLSSDDRRGARGQSKGALSSSLGAQAP